MATIKDFGKYIVEVEFNAKRSFFLWGNDLPEANKPNKLLCGNSSKVLRFSTPNDLIQYILDDNYLSFDEVNIKAWASSYNSAEEVTMFNLDSLSYQLNTFRYDGFVNKNVIAFLKNVLDILNIIDDYCQDIGDKELTLMLEEIQFRQLVDLLMDLIVWKEENEIKDKVFQEASSIIENSEIVGLIEYFMQSKTEQK